MEFSDTAPVLHAIAIAEASDEPLDVPGAAAELRVSSVLDSRTVWRSRPSPTRRVALDVDPVAPMGTHADMAARARVRGGMGWGPVGPR